MIKNLSLFYINIIGVIGSLFFFLVGINGMSSAIKNMGSDFANSVITTTNEPFVALFIGVIATVLFQSSSTTTSLIVGMVSSGAITLNGAIPMIMGANIGTTVTNTIVSIGHINRGEEFRRAFAASTVHDFFNLLAVCILFPLEQQFHMIQKSAEGIATVMFGKFHNVQILQGSSPIKGAIKWGSNLLEGISLENEIFYLIISIFLTFLMLFSLVKLLRLLVLSKIETFFDRYIFKTVLRGFGFGILFTILVQSSSITTSLVVPLAGAGILTLRQIFPYTLGANVGTTFTALLAALTGTVSALVAALSHLIFNLTAIIIIYPFPFLRNVPLKLAESIANAAVKKKYVPILYLIFLFVLLPLSIILIIGR